MIYPPTRDKIRIGDFVRIETKENQGTGKLTDGTVKEILTNSPEHTYGIKVRLEEGAVGRVKEIITSLSVEGKSIHTSTTIEDKLKAGEGLSIEYKSSFKFDVNRFKATGIKTQSKFVEEEISIAVAALANASGGTILIAVGDKGEILGIEDDISLLSNTTKEFFQRQLWQSLKDFLEDNAFVSTIKMKFNLISNKEICEIEVPPAFEPIYVRDSIQECYVRIGNRSEKFEPSDFVKYCSKRFSR